MVRQADAGIHRRHAAHMDRRGVCDRDPAHVGQRKRHKTLELFRAVPESWWKGEGITLSDLPTAFGALNLRAERRNGRIDVELNLSGEPPNLITFRYPHAKRAWANGKACSLRGDLVERPTAAASWWRFERPVQL